MRRIARFAAPAFAALAISCSWFDHSGIVTERFALVYGVTTYVTALAGNAYNDPNLSFPAIDARDVAAMFEEGGYKVKSRWVDEDGDVYVDGARIGPVDLNAGAAPSKAALANDLAALSGSLGPDDGFVFYFSGHGLQNSERTHEFLVPFGGIASRPYDSFTLYYVDEAGSVREDELGTFLAGAIPTPRQVVILDTCNSGGFIGNTLEVDATPPTTGADAEARFSLSTIARAIAAYTNFTTASSTGISAYAAQVLSAAGSGEFSYDDTGHGHGAMTHYLLTVAEFGDLNGDGAVSVLEAFSLVKAGIEENWNVDHPSSAFTPHVSGGPVDFVLF